MRLKNLNPWVRILAIILICSSHIFLLRSQTPQLDWIEHSGEYTSSAIFSSPYNLSVNISTNNKSIAKRSDGYVYTIGAFTGDITIGASQLSANIDERNAFLALYSPQGNPMWAKKISATTDLYLVGVVTNDDYYKHSYVTGWFEGTLTIGDQTITSEKGKDLFFAEFSSTGELEWIKHIKIEQDGYVFDIVAIPNRNGGYLCGQFSGEEADFDGVILDSNNGSEFLLRFNRDGDIDWIQQFTSEIKIKTLGVDANNNLYMGGDLYEKSNLNSILLDPVNGESFFLAKYSYEGNIVWAKIDGISVNGYPSMTGLSISTNGNIWIQGVFSGNVMDISGNQLSSQGFRDAFIARYDNSGNFEWARGLGGEYFDYPPFIDHDANDNLYIHGFYDSNITIGNSTLNAIGSTDMYLAKINTNGEVVFANSLGQEYRETALGIATDATGRSTLLGSFRTRIQLGSIQLVAQGRDAGLLTQVDEQGQVLLAKQTLGTNQSLGLGIAQDAKGNQYICGQFYGKVKFGDQLIEGKEGSDCFIASYTPQGELRWLKILGGTGNERGTSIKIGNNGEVYVCGIFSEELDFENTSFTSIGKSDVFLAKYDTNGKFIWAKNIGGVGEEYSYDLVLDEESNVFIIGNFEETALFGGTNTPLFSAGFEDIFIAKYLADGNLAWARSAGGVSRDEGRGVAVDHSGNSYITGYFYDRITFDNQEFIGNRSFDIFLTKYNPAGNIEWVKTWGSRRADYAYSVAVDDNNNVYITGSFRDTLTFGNVSTLSPNISDAFIFKTDSLGNELWGKQLVGPEFSYGRTLAITPQNELIVGGQFDGATDFGGQVLSAGKGSDGFVSLYKSNGDLKWAKGVSASFRSYVYDLSIDDFGNVYPVGSYQGTGNIDGNQISSTGSDTYYIGKIVPPGLPPLSVCLDQGTFRLQHGNPSGGVYVGDYVVNDSLFDPLIAGVGIHELTYRAEGRTYTSYITVVPPPNVNLLPLNNIGISQDTVVLAGGIPAGGVYVGKSVRDNLFFPKEAGIGTHQIGYIYTNETGCTDTAYQILEVIPFSVYPTPNSGLMYGNAQIEYLPAQNGDWIAAFDIRGQCVGAAPVKEDRDTAFFALTIYGDDDFTVNIDDGMKIGETFTLRLYDASNESYLNYSFPGDSIPISGWMNTNGMPISGLDNPQDTYQFFPNRTRKDTILLKAGWNLISTDVIPIDSAVSTVFGSLEPNNLVAVTGFDAGAVFYNPNFPPMFNSLTHIKRGFGYWVKVMESDSLIISGAYLNPAFRKEMDANWNLMAYIPQSPQDVEDYFQNSLTDDNLKYVMGFDDGNRFYNPVGPLTLNTLKELQNSFGYWVSFNQAAGAGAYRLASPKLSFSPTPNYMFVYGTIDAPYVKAQDSILVLNSAGQVSGILEVLPGNILRPSPIYGDDPITADPEGMKEGDLLRFRYKGQEITSEISFKSNQSFKEVNLSFDSPEAWILSPNPFQKELSLSFQTNQSTSVEISLIDINGREIKQLFNNTLLADWHYMNWSLEYLASGVYFIKIKTENTPKVFKIVKQ